MHIILDMHDLAALDLNLLVVLEALIEERHVSRAALRLNKSQPAVSHALARLRHQFDDPLLVRHGGRLELTPRAQELAPPLAEALHQIRQLAGPEDFDPGAASRVFRLAMSDYGAAIVLPGLVRRLRATAPRVDLVVTQVSREAMVSQISDGEIDLALGVFPALVSGLKFEPLFEETFGCLAETEAAAMDLNAYLARPHALVALHGGASQEVDTALGRLGKVRRIGLVVPHWSLAAGLIAGTDLVLTAARRSLMEVPGLRLFDPPFAIPPFTFGQIWRHRRGGDPAHRWLRDQVREAIAPAG